MQDQEDSMRITASSPPPRGQGGLRKRKPSQDRQPSKLIVRPSERGEEKVGNRPGPSAKGLLEKLGEKARIVMRMSPPSDKMQEASSQYKGQMGRQSLGRSEHGLGPGPTPVVAGTRQPSKGFSGGSEGADGAGGGQEGQAI